jgi:transcriptional antiterminator NusG
LKTYCVFCKTGSEKDFAQFVTTLDNRIKAITPVRVLQEKRKGKWEQREQTLFPGYVFLYTKKEMKFKKIIEASCLYKILDYETGFRELRGMDYEYSMWIYRHQGYIATSDVLVEGGEIKVIDGPLLDSHGTIVKLDKHKRRIWLEVNFDGKIRLVSLSAECVAVEDS